MTGDSVVFLNSGHRSQVVRLRDITSIQVSKNYVKIWLRNATTNDGPIAVLGSLKKCVAKLPSDLFFVTSRDTIVNLLEVAKVNAAARSILLAMRDGREITVSRKQSIKFRKQLVL